jgi:beta-1,2-mannosidase
VSQADDWQLGPFSTPSVVLGPDPALSFACPVSASTVAWAAKDVFNPAAIVRDDQIHLLFRAEDTEGSVKGTSRIGLATSADGRTFTIEPEPVLFPVPGRWQPWEWPGGCEDPRVVEGSDGGYVCLYTAFDGKAATLFVATSDDLRTWEHAGPAFAGTDHARRWSKSGAVVTELVDGRLRAARIGGRYWMYWGEGTCFAATSDDLVRWRPLEFDAGWDRYLTLQEGSDSSWDIERTRGVRALRPLLSPRPGRFDELLVEPGPPAVLTPDGIVLIYNGAQLVTEGSDIAVRYAPAQALFDPFEPGSCLARDTAPFLADESEGQVSGVCFAEGLVHFNHAWWLYYGMADSQIGCVSAPASH